MTITIGRGDDNIMKLASSKVSKHHCTATQQLDGFEIIDLDSTNGTWLNGMRVGAALFTPADKLLVADAPVSYESLDKIVKRMAVSDKTDFRKEFRDLKKLYNTYQADIRRIDEDHMKRDVRKRMLLSFTPLAVSLVAAPFLPAHTRTYAGLSGGAVSGIIAYMTSGKGMQERRKIEDKKTELRRDFFLKYRCPKCGVRFEYRDIVLLESDEKCFNCKAHFV